MKKEKGFTLVELLIVLAIIAALSTVLVPNIPRWINSAKAGVIESDIPHIANAMIQYVNSEGGSIPGLRRRATKLASSSLADFFTKLPSNPFRKDRIILVKTSNRNSGDINDDFYRRSFAGEATYGYIVYTDLPDYVSKKIKNDMGDPITLGKFNIIRTTAAASAIFAALRMNGKDNSSIVYRVKLKKEQD